MRAILLVLVLLLLAPCRVLAQPAPALTPAQARAALEVLNDPKKRAEVTATLEAIAKAEPTPPHQAAHAATPPAQAAAKPAAAPAKPAGIAIPLAPDSLGAQILLRAEALVGRTSSELAEAAHAMRSVPLLWDWMVVMTTDPWARGILLDVAWRLAVALACALAVEFALRRALRRPVAGLEGPPARPGAAPTAEPDDTAPAADATATDTSDEQAEAGAPVPLAADADDALPSVTESAEARAEAGELEPPRRLSVSARAMMRRVPLALARFVLDLLPVLGFVLAGHLVAASTVGGQASSRLVILAVVDAYGISAATLCLVRMLLSPTAPRLRLFRLSDPAAAYLMRWIRRIVIIAVFGYAVAEVGYLLGLSDVAHRALLKLNGFVLRVLLATMVLQKRRAVRRWLRARPDSTNAMARLRNALASVWHWIALFFIFGSWLVWAVEVPDGFNRLLRFCIIAGLLLVGARLLLIVLDGALDRALLVPPETAQRYPGLEARLRLYHPGLSALLRGIVYALWFLAILQAYGVDSFAWFADTTLGQRTVSAFGTSLVTVLLALAAWEGANAAMQRHLAKLAKDQQAARSARLRTLMPLLRSALLITIVVFAGLTVLSEIGINIGPLLAGAGIVGVAIGFGSQKLVQDLITGVFLLLENAMQVGDWVTVSGLSGSVENLSVRTIRLRAGDGSVHIIPFSAVTTVTNVNRGLGNAPVSVTVEFEEDTDRVSAVLKEIIAGMRAEPDFAGKMLSDFQLWGVDKVDGAGVTITGQVVCTDSGRWSVQREFNRRMKMRFQELGIRLLNPMRNIAIPVPVPAPAVEDQAHERPRAAD